MSSYVLLLWLFCLSLVAFYCCCFCCLVSFLDFVFVLPLVCHGLVCVSPSSLCWVCFCFISVFAYGGQLTAGGKPSTDKGETGWHLPLSLSALVVFVLSCVVVSVLSCICCCLLFVVFVLSWDCRLFLHRCCLLLFIFYMLFVACVSLFCCVFVSAVRIFFLLHMLMAHRFCISFFHISMAYHSCISLLHIFIANLE